MIEFKLPSLGADMDEGKLLEWKVKPGDKVKRGDVVAVVDTSKAAVEVEIWEDGVVDKLIVEPGKTIPVGTVLALLRAPGEAAPAAAAPAVKVMASAEAPMAQRRRISPAARKHAEERSIDVEKIEGTGPGGAVTVEDVERAAMVAKVVAVAKAPPAAKPPPIEPPKEKPAAPPPGDRAAEMRKAIAAAMSRSKREIPHYYLSELVPMLRATQWLERENEKRSMLERILMATLQLKAVALALGKFPDLNGVWREGVYRPSGPVHVGVAISLRGGGLVAPAIHDAAELSLDELMKALADLVKRARAGSLRSSEMSDPTITVSNLGDGGVDSTFPIIYPPQVAIVGFGRVAWRPWAEGEALRAMPTVVATVSADHRVSDGHRGALFLAEVSKRLQEPENL